MDVRERPTIRPLPVFPPHSLTHSMCDRLMCGSAQPSALSRFFPYSHPLHARHVDVRERAILRPFPTFPATLSPTPCATKICKHGSAPTDIPFLDLHLAVEIRRQRVDLVHVVHEVGQVRVQLVHRPFPELERIHNGDEILRSGTRSKCRRGFWV